MAELSEMLGIATYQWPDGRIVIRLVGELDASGAPRLIDETGRVDPHVGDRVVLHLADVTLIDAAAIGALCYVDAFVRSRQGDLMFDSPSWKVRADLEAAGLADRIVGDGQSGGIADAVADHRRSLAGAGDEPVRR
jgi:anti-anti-sigma factor